MTLRSNCVLGASVSEVSAVACSAAAAARGGGRAVDVELTDAVLDSEREEADVGGGGRVPSESGLEAVEVALAEASEFSEADGPGELPTAS